jgi:uncharacterized protein YgbK (DUF1537 family)
MTDKPTRVIVLDDDPTGTQTVAGVPVVLTPERGTLERAAGLSPGPLWVLTNTRAMGLAAAQSTLSHVAREVRAVFGQSARLVLRGDSTLRGHVLGEIDTLSMPGSVALFVPAFIELGRVTIDGVHYVTDGGRRIGVASTEYARDPEFAYRTSSLIDWIADRDPARPALGLSADVLRGHGPSALSDLLVTAPDGAVIIPDAETFDDLHAIRDAWLDAQQRGRQVVLRCAASLASVITGLRPRPVTLTPADGPVLVVCGSHTAGAAAQLAALTSTDDIVSHEIDIAQVLPAVSADHGYIAQFARAVAESLSRRRVAVLSTPRVARPDNLTLAAGEAIMDALVATVRQLRGTFSALVTKGGITSARIARDSLRVPIAYVEGQVLPGIPVWSLSYPPGDGIEHVIVPGNVGPPTAIRDIVDQLTTSAPVQRRPSR